MSDFPLLDRLNRGELKLPLAALYAPKGAGPLPEEAESRVLQVLLGFARHFGSTDQAALFSAPGRTELGGNHTDHQHGHVLCASVDLDVLACAAPNGTSLVRIVSEGHPYIETDISDLQVYETEKNRSEALIRGTAAYLIGLGAALSGFDAYVTSNVPAGSGLSSSAAFEILLGTIFDHFFCGSRFGKLDLARAGQFAENRYFGKPSGIMDQLGSVLGGAAALDLADPGQPQVRKMDFPFAESGHALCLIDTCSSHADLTGEYAAIPQEMGAVAARCGKSVLREVPEEEFLSALPELRRDCGDRAVLRALHFYDEDRRSQQEAAALERGDFAEFLRLVNASGLSSELLLQNVWSPLDHRRQPLTVALAYGRKLLAGAGAIRVHGGGFSGTVQAFVPLDELTGFQKGMAGLLGADACRVLRIRPQGGCVIR
ncbi:MAG: galactokinase [Firmicutes bacterium]|nr:galactokinase [Bacillota bacterium]